MQYEHLCLFHRFKFKFVFLCTIFVLILNNHFLINARLSISYCRNISFALHILMKTYHKSILKLCHCVLESHSLRAGL